MSVALCPLRYDAQESITSHWAGGRDERDRIEPSSLQQSMGLRSVCLESLTEVFLFEGGYKTFKHTRVHMAANRLGWNKYPYKMDFNGVCSSGAANPCLGC